MWNLWKGPGSHLASCVNHPFDMPRYIIVNHGTSTCYMDDMEGGCSESVSCFLMFSGQMKTEVSHLVNLIP